MRSAPQWRAQERFPQAHRRPMTARRRRTRAARCAWVGACGRACRCGTACRGPTGVQRSKAWTREPRVSPTATRRRKAVAFWIARVRHRHAGKDCQVRVVVMGCGRVGASLADSLARIGHEVAVIDRDTTAFHRLSPEFAGERVLGMGFDRDVLLRAGIEEAGAFAAVSSGDNSNIIAARVARETFGVERVVARIYDPKRAEVYERLGIPTVATVRWAADQILQRILPEGAAPEWFDASGNVVLAQVLVGQGWIGQPLHRLERAAAVRAACITRYGEGSIPDNKTVLQEGDLLHLLIPRPNVQEV